MNQDNNSINDQLTDLTARLCAAVAERLAQWTRDVDPQERKRIIAMIEDQLPAVVANTIAKTASLHSPAGVAYLEQHLNQWADDFARKFIGQ